jgi:hypothetical protein
VKSKSLRLLSELTLLRISRKVYRPTYHWRMLRWLVFLLFKWRGIRPFSWNSEIAFTQSGYTRADVVMQCQNLPGFPQTCKIKFGTVPYSRFAKFPLNTIAVVCRYLTHFITRHIATSVNWFINTPKWPLKLWNFHLLTYAATWNGKVRSLQTGDVRTHICVCVCVCLSVILSYPGSDCILSATTHLSVLENWVWG